MLVFSGKPDCDAHGDENCFAGILVVDTVQCGQQDMVVESVFWTIRKFLLDFHQ